MEAVQLLTPLTLSLTRVRSDREQPCTVCGAQFVPSEDSGSRALSIAPSGQQALSVLMCGGCHSKWSHGVSVTIRGDVKPSFPDPVVL
jgi:hypothetical protein